MRSMSKGDIMKKILHFGPCGGTLVYFYYKSKNGKSCNNNVNKIKTFAKNAVKM